MLLVLFSKCNPTKKLADDEYLVSSVKIDCKKFSKENCIESRSKCKSCLVNEDDLKSVIKQKPNRQIFGFIRFHLWLYNHGLKKKEKIEKKNKKKSSVKIKKRDKEDKVNTSVGEPPVILDTLLTTKSEAQIKRYLEGKGFFNSQVNSTYKNFRFLGIKQKQQKKIVYTIKTGSAYKIRNKSYTGKDSIITHYIKQDTTKSLVKKGDNFDVDKLEAERVRITRMLKNLGYYYFDKELITYKADSSGKKQKIDLIYNIKGLPVKVNDSIVYKLHRKCYINNVNVFVNCDKNGNKDNYTQTIEEDINFFEPEGKNRYNYKTLAKAILFNLDNYYQLAHHDATYQRLAELGVFKFITIDITPDQSDDILLNINIILTSSKSKSITLEPKLTNNIGNLGIYGNVGFQNKNTFKGAEKLTLSVAGGLQAQQLLFEDKSQQQSELEKIPYFNTYEIGPELKLEFPKLFIPFLNQDRVSENSNPSTEFDLIYNFQKRQDFSRNVFKASMAYKWNETKQKQHIIQPLELSLIRLFPSPAFRDFLATSNDAFVINSYKDHLIAASTYSFIYKSDLNKKRNYSYFRFNVEAAGNLLNLYSNLTNNKKDSATNSYHIIGIRYAQYVKTDVDFRRYFNFRSSSFVVRNYLGAALPYGNLNVMPFQRAFYGGGANEMRAWQVRTLGPGGLADSSIFTAIDQVGDLKFETNFEYRFDITNLFELAIFTDMGNIWLMEKDPKRPEADFQTDKIWKHMAIGTGVGLRLDFSFFILRFDLGFKLKNPARDNPYKIGFQKNESGVFNLGIGYPF